MRNRMSEDDYATFEKLRQKPSDRAMAMLEKDLMRNVLAVAKAQRWMAYHTYSSKKSEAGFPDLILLRKERCLAVELKKESEVPTKAQVAWLEAFARVPGVEKFVWRPSDWINGDIERALG